MAVGEGTGVGRGEMVLDFVYNVMHDWEVREPKEVRKRYCLWENDGHETLGPGDVLNSTDEIAKRIYNRLCIGHEDSDWLYEGVRLSAISVPGSWEGKKAESYWATTPHLFADRDRIQVIGPSDAAVQDFVVIQRGLIKLIKKHNFKWGREE